MTHKPPQDDPRGSLSPRTAAPGDLLAVLAYVVLGMVLGYGLALWMLA